MPVQLFENENLTIRYDEDSDYLLLKWNGFTGEKSFRDLADQVIAAIESTHSKRILSDHTNWKTISPNDQGWAAHRWFPRAEEKGIKMLATVLSRDFFNRVAERSIEGMADVDCMQIKNFTSIDGARSWLTKSKSIQDC